MSGAVSSPAERFDALPRARVDGLVADGEGRRFDPGHGRIMKEWFELTADSTMAWPALAQAALEHVGRATR
jgi:hypothetical protein